MKVVDAVVEVLFLDKDDNLVPVPENLPVTDDTVPDVANEKIEPLPFKDDDLFPFRTKFRVYFEDTDLQGIMFHVSYVRYCERALFDLIRSIWPDASMNQWMAKTNATVGRIDIRYLQSTVLGDRVEVRTTLVNMTLTKLRFGQRIVFVETGQVVADAVTDVDFRDAEGNDLVVPKQIADVAAAHIARFNKKAR
jgi:acyl-CoA thioester hydrolase